MNTFAGVTVAIPVFNEERIIESNLRRLVGYLDGLGLRYEVLIGSNGSTDRTPDIGDSLARELPCVAFFHRPERGVGHVFRSFTESARYPVLVSLDMDLSVDLDFIPAAMRLLNEADVVIGSKRLGTDARPWHRKLASKAFIGATRLLLGRRESDYSIAGKAYRVELLRRYLHCVDAGSSYVLGICHMAAREGARLVEVPVRVEDRRRSRFNLPSEALYKFKHLLRVWRMSRFLMGDSQC